MYFVLYFILIFILFFISSKKVPANFLLDVFAKSGVRREKLRVIPIPIDIHSWDPMIVEPLPAVDQILQRIDAELTSPFNFLSVFKWEKRKGWDVLLEAYWKEFKREENTTLFMQTYLYGVSAFMARDPEMVMEEVEKHAMKLGLQDQFKRGLLPRIEILTKELPESDMPRLFKPFDAFVLPTRGEGFGTSLSLSLSLSLFSFALSLSHVGLFF